MTYIILRKPVSEEAVLTGPFEHEDEAVAYLNDLPDEDDLEIASVLFLNPPQEDPQ